MVRSLSSVVLQIQQASGTVNPYSTQQFILPLYVYVHTDKLFNKLHIACNIGLNYFNAAWVLAGGTEYQDKASVQTSGFVILIHGMSLSRLLQKVYTETRIYLKMTAIRNRGFFKIHMMS